MVKIVLLGLALFCATALATDVRDTCAKIIQNVRFEAKRSRIAGEMSVFDLNRAALAKAKTAEEKTCLNNAKMNAVSQILTLLGNSIGQILPQLDDIDKNLAAGNAEPCQMFANKMDYDSHKIKMQRKFADGMAQLLPPYKQALQDCA